MLGIIIFTGLKIGKIECGHDELYLLAAALALNVITVTRFVIIEHRWAPPPPPPSS